TQSGSRLTVTVRADRAWLADRTAPTPPRSAARQLLSRVRRGGLPCGLYPGRSMEAGTMATGRRVGAVSGAALRLAVVLAIGTVHAPASAAGRDGARPWLDRQHSAEQR